MPDDVQFVEFFGERFAVPERINKRLMYKLARLADEGGDSAQGEGAKVWDRLLDQMVRPEDLDRFNEVCDRERVQDEELMEFVADVVAATSGRPTSRSSDSSAGPTPTPQNSAGDSSLRVIARLENQGRPDIAAVVAQAQGLTA